MKINFIKLDINAIVPTYGSPASAGADLYALSHENITIPAHETKIINTGIALEIPSGYVGLVFARSGLASKRSLAPANKVGVIDSDYRGEIMVALHNHSDIPQMVAPNERIAQLAIVPYIAAEFNEVASISSTERGSGGFGSTGTK